MSIHKDELTPEQLQKEQELEKQLSRAREEVRRLLKELDAIQAKSAAE